ncbi:transcriptional regulator, LysR family [Paraburkholderia atlantica]|uniref:Transcriptional regulator, LysR family n=2 Tax=Paraburkholderia atlantica TaxID=2654982 RepID=D5WMB8_PARAM|nr:transcriptional regulator, LysR family [Paraburkholderia atlantica]
MGMQGNTAATGRTSSVIALTIARFDPASIPTTPLFGFERSRSWSVCLVHEGVTYPYLDALAIKQWLSQQPVVETRMAQSMQMRESIKLHQLVALVAIADTGSVRSAAAILGVTAQAVAKNLRQLQESLRMPLVLHTPAGIVLTDGGRMLLQHARLIVGQTSRALDDIDTLRGQPRGRLSFGLPPWMVMAFLPDTMKRFEQTLPGVALETFDGYLVLGLPRLRDGSIDFLIGRPTPEDLGAEFNFRPLLVAGNGVVARQGHPAAGKHSLADLLDYGWLLSRDPGREAHLPANIFTRHGLPSPRALHYVHSLAAVIYLLQHSDRLSIFPWPLIELCSRRQNLCVIPVQEEIEEQTIGIVTLAGRPQSVASTCFIGYLIDTIRDVSNSDRPETRRMMRSVELLI